MSYQNILFDTTRRGLVPVSSGVVTEYLRSDGQWETPSAMVHDTLSVSSTDVITNLSSVPSGPVIFLVNGLQVDGITNAGQVVSVNAATLGYSIQTTDVVKAVYLS